MVTTSLLPNQVGRFVLGAVDGDGVARPATFSVKVADYSLGYVFAQGSQIYFVPKANGTTTILISGAAADSSPLPNITMEFVTAVPPPPHAANFTTSTVEILNHDITTPGDPGSDTVTGSL